MANVSKNIKQIRIKNNMTQEELAEALFVTRQTISNYENGKSNPDIETIIKIADIFKVDANTVIYGLPLEESQKRNKNWAIGIGVFLVLLLCSIFVIDKLLEPYNEGYYIPPPENILTHSLIPLAFFVGGFYTMHILGLITPLKPLDNLAAKILRIILLIIIFLLSAGVLYYAVFAAYSFIKFINDINISIRWYGFFKLIIFSTIATKYPFVFSVLGALSWLFGLIYRKK